MTIRLAATALACALSFGACTSLPSNEVPTEAAATQLAASETLQKEVRGLNNLIAIMSDANKLYTEASQMSGDAALAQMLEDIAASREGFGIALQDRVADLGGDPATRGEALGTGHRAFTQGRALVQNNSMVAVEEVLRGENYLLDEMAALLEDGLSRESEQMLEAELQEVRADRNALKEARENLATADDS